MKVFSLMMLVWFGSVAVNARAAQVESIAESCQTQCCLPCGCSVTNCNPDATKYTDLVPLNEKSGPNGDTTIKAQGQN